LKVIAILTRESSLADETSSLPRSDSIATLRKRPPETRAKILRRSNGGIKNYGYFNPLLKSGLPDLLFTELGFLINPKENSFRKLVQNFNSDPMV
jgi:hypothetical protein